MDINPYQSPENPAPPPGVEPAAQEPAEELLSLAQAQMTVCYTMLVSLGLTGIAAWVRQTDSVGMQVIAIALIIGICVAQALAVFRLAVHVYHSSVAALLVIAFAVIPLLGLVALAFANQKATDRLKAAGVRVGFMGPPSSEMTRLRQLMQEEQSNES